MMYRLDAAISIVICYLISGTISGARVKILYDEIFEDSFHYLPQRLVNYSVNLQQIRSDDNLQNITSLFDNEARVITFTNSRQVPNHADIEQYDFGRSLFELESIADASSRHCVSLTETYVHLMTSLIVSILYNGVALIADDDHCSRKFIESISENLIRRHKRESSPNVHLHKVFAPRNPTRWDSMAQAFYSLKTSEVKFIILLTSVEHAPKILEEAKRYDLCGVSHLWFIPDYYDGMTSSVVPTEILTINTADIRTKTFYKNLNLTVPELFEAIMTKTSSCYRASNPSSCKASMLYEIIRKNEHVVPDVFIIDIKYRNLLDDTTWASVRAEVSKDQFALQDNTLPMLRSISGNGVPQLMRVVTIFEEPYTVEMKDALDERHKKCNLGMLCRKPISSYPNTTTFKYEYTCCIGFVIELFQSIIVNELDLEIDLYIVPDGKYGVLEQGKWNGMIAEIYEGRADMALGEIVVTKQRSDYIDFTAPYVESKMAILVKPQILTLNFLNWDFIAPLSTELQIVLWFVIVGAMILNYVFENNVYLLSLTDEYVEDQKYYSAFESMSYISGVTLQRDLGAVNPARVGARVSAIIFAFGMVIVVTTYTAVLAAQSVQNQEKNPFLGSKDPRMRNPTEDFKFAVLKSGSFQSFFRESESDVLKRMGIFMEKYNVDTVQEGFVKVSNGNLQALMGDYQLLQWRLLQEQYCEMRLISDPFIHVSYGFAVRKDLPLLTKLLSDIILQNTGSGEINSMLRKWHGKSCDISILSSRKKLGINDFGGLIILLCVTAIVCFPMLISEFLYRQYLQNSLTKVLKNRFRKNLPKNADESD